MTSDRRLRRRASRPLTAQPITPSTPTRWDGARAGEPAARTGGDGRARRGGVRLRRRALPHRRGARRRRLGERWRRPPLTRRVADPGLRARQLPGPRYALTPPKIGVYTGATTAPTNPVFPGTGNGHCTSAAYCEIIFDSRCREGPRPRGSADHVERTSPPACTSARATRRSSTPRSTIVGGPRRDRAAGVRQRRRPVRHHASRAPTSARNAALTTLNTNPSAASPRRLDVRRDLRRPIRPPGASTPAAGSTARRAATPRTTRQRSAGNGGTIPAALRSSTYGPSGDSAARR